MRGDAAADAGGEAAEDEGQRLVAVEAEAVGARRHVVVADGAKAAAEMRAEQPHLQQRQHDHDREAEPVDRRHADKLDSRTATAAGCRETPIGPRVTAFPVQDDQRYDLADRQRRDRDVMPAQTERRRDQQRAERRAHQPAAR